MQPRVLSATMEDVQKLCDMNPLAAEQLKSIILERMLNEAEAKLSVQNEQDMPNG